jgi:general secretion pathway protein I
LKRRPRLEVGGNRGFTLIEVLVALMVVAMGLAALMIAVSSTARTSGYLRDKTLAQWMALNRLSEVRLNLSKFGQNTDTGELYFANRTWHYDTRYFDTSITTMKRVVVRVYAGDAKTKGNPVAESTGFTGGALSIPFGQSNNADWTAASSPAPGSGGAGNTNPPGAPSTNPPAQNPSGPQTPPPLPNPNQPPPP